MPNAMLRRLPTLRTFRAIYISSDCQNISEQTECCICLAPYDDQSHQAVSVTSNSDCEHVFGRHCLNSWLDSTRPNRNTCPICRRKWYSRTSMVASSPRDTNTSQVLEPPTHARNPARDRSESRARRRAFSQNYVQTTRNGGIALRVEELVTSMEALESLERMGMRPLGQNVRIQLQQVEDRIRTFVERSSAETEGFPGLAVHRANVPRVNEVEPRDLPEAVPVRFGYSRNHSPGAYSSTNIQSSRLPRPVQLNAVPTPARILNSPYLAETSVFSRPSRATTRRRSASRDLGVEQPVPSSNDAYGPALSAGNSSATSDHSLGILGHTEDKTQVDGSRLLHNIAELEGHTPEISSRNQGLIRSLNPDIRYERSLHHSTPTAGRDEDGLPQHQAKRPRRTGSTQDFTYESQSVRIDPHQVQTASLSELPVSHESTATDVDIPGALSRMMSLSSLRNLVTGEDPR